MAQELGLGQKEAQIMRRPKWSHVVIALAVIASLAIASPVFGISKSIKKAIKSEVARQLAGKTGPAGTNGTNGADGTARAYARVLGSGLSSCVGGCAFDRAKGIAGVTRPSTGNYCVDAPGINAGVESAAVSVDAESTFLPRGNASAMANGSCSSTRFLVYTERQPSTTVCTNSTCSTTATVAGSPVATDDVAFTIVIP